MEFINTMLFPAANGLFRTLSRWLNVLWGLSAVLAAPVICMIAYRHSTEIGLHRAVGLHSLSQRLEALHRINEALNGLHSAPSPGQAPFVSFSM